MYRAAVDIGGTFTDVAAFDDRTGRLLLGKWSTTPARLVDGVLKALERAEIDLRETAMLIHGSTVVINALIERSGARTALVTTRGFRDVYEIGRINRPESFNLFTRKHEPLVPRERRFEVAERLDAQGEVLIPFDEAGARALARRLATMDVDAVAVVFLHSYRNPAHELRMQEILREEAPRLFVAVSHEISREYREYERTSTVAANAYVGPKVSAYLDQLEQRTEAAGFRGSLYLVQSNGGLYDPAAARRQCILMLESGPGRVAGATVIGKRLGVADAICFDMGGTTAKACVIEAGLPRGASDYFVGGYARGLALRVAALDIQEVGTGGGSIARVDGRAACTSARRAPAPQPGPPATTAAGREPTVTDADLLLGRIDDRGHLGGELTLDRALARRALQDAVATPLDLSVEEAALGILRIATASMAYAVRAVTIERGLDPRDFSMLAYGGGGPLHATAVARELLIPRSSCRLAPAVFSAVGMLSADLRRDYVRTCFVPLRDAALDEIEATYQEMAAEGIAALSAARAHFDDLAVVRAADMRYVGQEHSVLVPVADELTAPDSREALKEAFDAPTSSGTAIAPRRRTRKWSACASPSSPASASRPARLPSGSASPPAEARRAQRPIYFDVDRGFVECPVYLRECLLAGNRIAGPAAIDEYGTTTLLLRATRPSSPSTEIW